MTTTEANGGGTARATAERPDPERLAERLVDGVRALSRDVVEHFLAQMPTAYFRDTPQDVQASHVGAILGARASGLPVALTLVSADSNTWTFIDENSQPGQLAAFVARLPGARKRGAAPGPNPPPRSVSREVFLLGGG
ncbi:MAG: hypothetical protein AAGD86_13025 [Pseudomonadota bacterium]